MDRQPDSERRFQMAQKKRTTQKTFERIDAMEQLMAGLQETDTPAGECPKCGGALSGYKRTDDERIEALVRCTACGYFFVVRG